MDKQDHKIVKQTVEKLFSVLGVQSPFIINDSQEGVEIVLQTAEENGILIGYHGETLEALQLILALAIAKHAGKFIRVSVEIGEYKKNRMEYLQRLVSETKEKVLAEKTGVSIPSLKSWERRYVHMLLQDDEAVMSESSGEGRDRVLTIFPK